MKVLPVSLSFRSNKYENNPDSAYMYTGIPYEQKDYTYQYKLLTALAAFSAVAITLFNLGGKKVMPDGIVEIKGEYKGLNRLLNQDKLVEVLKTKFLYPLKAGIMGDKRIRRSENFNTGAIITGANKSNLSGALEALSEHMEELGFDVVKFKTTTTRTKKDGTVLTRNLKKNEIIKHFSNTVKNAHTKFLNEGKYTVINVGDLDKLTKFKVAKNEKSSIDEILEGINNKKYKGVIWIGYTTKGKSIPLSFNELPILVTKLAE